MLSVTISWGNINVQLVNIFHKSMFSSFIVIENCIFLLPIKNYHNFCLSYWVSLKSWIPISRWQVAVNILETERLLLYRQHKWNGLLIGHGLCILSLACLAFIDRLSIYRLEICGDNRYPFWNPYYIHLRYIITSSNAHLLICIPVSQHLDDISLKLIGKISRGNLIKGIWQVHKTNVYRCFVLWIFKWNMF